MGQGPENGSQDAYLEDVAHDDDYQDNNINTQLAVGVDLLAQAVFDVIIIDCSVLGVCNGFADVARNRSTVMQVGRHVLASTRIRSKKFADPLGRVRIIDVITALWTGVDALVTHCVN